MSDRVADVNISITVTDREVLSHPTHHDLDSLNQFLVSLAWNVDPRQCIRHIICVTWLPFTVQLLSLKAERHPLKSGVSTRVGFETGHPSKSILRCICFDRHRFVHIIERWSQSTYYCIFDPVHGRWMFRIPLSQHVFLHEHPEWGSQFWFTCNKHVKVLHHAQKSM